MKNEEIKVKKEERTNNCNVKVRGCTCYGNQKAITLIALIITIIILLILAGVTISIILGKNGLISLTKNAGEDYIKEGLKEELEAEILNIQGRKILEGKEFKREDLSELSKIGAIMDSYGIPAEGEYKDYFFEVDEKYVVTILDKQKGEKPTITGNIVTQGIVLEGGAVEIKVTAGISEGKIEKIEATNGATLKEDAQNTETEKTFTVNKNGTYYFKVTADNKRTNVVSVIVNTIIEKPEIVVKDITYDGFTIEVINNYQEGIVKEYKYYVEGTLKSSATQDKKYTVTGLWDDTEYTNVYVEAYFDIGKLTSDTKTTITKPQEGKVYLFKGGNEYAELTGGFGFQGFAHAYDPSYYPDGASTGDFNINKNDNLLTISTYRLGYGFYCRTNELIDFGDGIYSKMGIKYKDARVTSPNSQYGVWDAITKMPGNGKARYEIDVSNITGQKRVGFSCASGEFAIVEEIYLVEK